MTRYQKPPFPLDGLAQWLEDQIASTKRILAETHADSTDRIRLKALIDAYGYIADRFTAPLAQQHSGSDQQEGLLEKLEAALAACYATDSSAIARLCDEHLDPSGALLGRIRDLAQQAILDSERSGSE